MPEAKIEMLQVVVGVEEAQSETEAIKAAIAQWETVLAGADGVVKLAEPVAEVADIDPELNEGYSRAVNVCGNVMRR